MSRNIIDVYDRSIFEMKNLFTPEECKEYIEYYEKRLHKFQGQTIDTLGKISVNTDFKDSLDAHLFGDGRAPNQPPIAQRLWNLYMDKLKICHSEYMKHVAPLDPTEPHGPFILKNFMHRGRSTTPQIQRTDKGCKGFAWHTDSSGCGGKETRNIAVIIYLNDIDNDGSMKGYNKFLIDKIYSKFKVPLTVSGGFNNFSEIKNIFTKFKIIGVCCSSLFVFKGKNKAVLLNYPNKNTLEILKN